jgi:hypothetical protein
MIAFVRHATSLHLAFEIVLDMKLNNRFASFINQKLAAHLAEHGLAFSQSSSTSQANSSGVPAWHVMIPGQKPQKSGTRALLKIPTKPLVTFTRKELDAGVDRYPACPPTDPENPQSLERRIISLVCSFLVLLLYLI